MCVKAVAGEITVVRLVIHPYGEIAAWEQQVSDVKVAYEIRLVGIVDIIPVSELTVYEKPVVHEPATEQSLILGIVPSLVARRDVGSKVPVAALHEIGEHVVYLL